MNNNHRPHFPVAILVHNGDLILSAANNHAEIPKRLPDGYLTETDGLLTKVTADISGQKTAKGELGPLTKQQTDSLVTLHHCMSQARKTAKLAFPGQTVKLHQEFQTGAHDQNDLASFLGRADIVLGSVKSDKNLPTLKLKGWTDAETTAFLTARDAFGPAEQYREKSVAGAKDTTAQKNADAAALYEHILTIQNAADLHFPTTDSANAGVRDEFRLGIFPPDHGGNHAPAPAPTPTPAPTPPAN
ncbi:MAG: hypothetical protein KGJ60_14195 [Verrucomicrobiota bacterium]|nr:hypothetical protein [Verrucomicrobiota bacterium]